jgi:hypothetical protein
MITVYNGLFINDYLQMIRNDFLPMIVKVQSKMLVSFKTNLMHSNQNKKKKLKKLQNRDKVQLKPCPISISSLTNFHHEDFFPSISQFKKSFKE